MLCFGTIRRPTVEAHHRRGRAHRHRRRAPRALHLYDEFARRLLSPGRVGLQRFQNHVLQRGADRRVQLTWRRGRLHRNHRRQLPRQAVVQRCTQRVNVTARVRVAREMLRRHILDSANPRPRFLPRRDNRRDAKIQYFDRAIRQQHQIAGLDVAVDQVARVGILERARDLLRHCHDHLYRQFALLCDKRFEIGAGQELDGDEIQARRGVAVRVVHLDDVRVLELRQQLRFTRELFDEIGCGEEVRMEHLERDLTLQDGMPRAVHRGLPTTGDVGEELVSRNRLTNLEHCSPNPARPKTGRIF